VASELDAMKLKEVVKCVCEGAEGALAYTGFPMEHWRSRTNYAIKRLNWEIRRCTRVVGTFPDGSSIVRIGTTEAESMHRSAV